MAGGRTPPGREDDRQEFLRETASLRGPRVEQFDRVEDESDQTVLEPRAAGRCICSSGNPQPASLRYHRRNAMLIISSATAMPVSFMPTPARSWSSEGLSEAMRRGAYS